MMAISKHKVLSEMQQQLELASSKCGNLQKQLEIVKDKVVNSSSTHLPRYTAQFHGEKENKTENVETASDVKSGINPPMSSSSSSEDLNDEEENADIIKVFYERLGQLEYTKGPVELSDVTSENDLDIDQLLSSVDINEAKSEFDDARSSVGTAEEPALTIAAKKAKSRKNKGKTARKFNLYDSPTAKRQKKKKITNAAQPKKADKVRPTVHPEIFEPKQNGLRSVVKCRSKRVVSKSKDDSPMDVRKSKSSTVADKKGSFKDRRSLTRLVGEIATESDSNAKGDSFREKIPPPNILNPEANSILAAILNDKLFQRKAKEVEKYENGRVEKEKPKAPVKKPSPVRVESDIENRPKNDQPKARTVFTVTDNKSNRKVSTTIRHQQPMKPAAKPEKIPVGQPSVNCKIKPAIKVEPGKNVVNKINDLDKSKENVDKPVKLRNGFGPTQEKVKFKPKIADDGLRKMAPDQKRAEIEKKPADSGKTTNQRILSRTNSQSTTLTCRDITKKQEAVKVAPVSHTRTSASAFPIDYCKEKEYDVDPLALNQLKKMKDAVMKFNAIPFIVGQSTSKSYHLGLNIQQTYSLFKQTPSVTALKVNNGKVRAGGTNGSIYCGSSIGGRSLSTRGGARDGGCPACDPAPDPSPEQLEDPWAVPQDGASLKVCTCLPKRIISFDQVLNQLYFSEINLRLHPSLLPNKDGSISSQGEDNPVKEKQTIAHRGTNSLYYTKILRKIQCLKDNLLA